MKLPTLPACPPLVKLTLVSAIVAASLAVSPARAEVPVYGYKVTAKMPQSRDNFVQGLQILDGHLYVSTGNYGSSSLLRYDMNNGELLDERPLDSRLFAEGLTVFGERIYQLTWKSRLLLIYNKADFQGIAHFRIPGQGWGLTHNGKDLIYSDGSHRLHYLSPESGTMSHSIEVTENGHPVSRLNELEWIDGQVWANVWQTDRIVMINPVTGEVTASINLRGLLPEPERQPATDVLNGIARNPDDGTLWVTGKNWPWIYQIELINGTNTQETNYE